MQQGIGALLVAQEPSYNPLVEHIVALAARHMMPAMYGLRLYAVAGGVMSYDASVSDSIRQVGGYVGRILKGEKPVTCPFCSRPSSTSSSTSRLQKRLA